MSKITSANLSGGKVTVNGVEVPDAKIVVAGKGASSGFIIGVEDALIYFANTQKDLDKTLDLIKSLIDTLSSGINPANLGGAITNASFTSGLATAQTTLQQIKENLV